MKLFEDTFKFCKHMTHITELSFSTMLKNMDVGGLKALLDFLKHDTTKRELKLEKVATFGKDQNSFVVIVLLPFEVSKNCF